MMRGSQTNCDSSDANPFLQNLQPNDELDAATQMQGTRRAASDLLGHHIPEHVEVAVGFAGFLLEFRNISDVLKLGFGH